MARSDLNPETNGAFGLDRTQKGFRADPTLTDNWYQRTCPTCRRKFYTQIKEQKWCSDEHKWKEVNNQR
jgi:hypothetical protein